MREMKFEEIIVVPFRGFQGIRIYGVYRKPAIEHRIVDVQFAEGIDAEADVALHEFPRFEEGERESAYGAFEVEPGDCGLHDAGRHEIGQDAAEEEGVDLRLSPGGDPGSVEHGLVEQRPESEPGDIPGDGLELVDNQRGTYNAENHGIPSGVTRCRTQCVFIAP